VCDNAENIVVVAHGSDSRWRQFFQWYDDDQFYCPWSLLTLYEAQYENHETGSDDPSILRMIPMTSSVIVSELKPKKGELFPVKSTTSAGSKIKGLPFLRIFRKLRFDNRTL
jgi:hypothetical protein